MPAGQHLEDLSKHRVTNRSAEVEHVAAPVVRAEVEPDTDAEQLDSAGRVEALADQAEVVVEVVRVVNARLESAGVVELYGVGVGLDLSPYYARSHVLDLGGSIGNAMFREVLEMLAGRHRR